MPSAKNRKAIAGSEKQAVAGAKVVGDVDPQEVITITVEVKSQDSGKKIAEAAGALMPHERQYQTREEFAAQRGADPTDVAQVEAFAHEHGLTVVESSAAKRTVKLSGTIENLSKAFGVKLKRYKAPGFEYRGRTGSISVPSELAKVVEGVFGFDDRPVAQPHFRLLTPSGEVSDFQGTGVKAMFSQAATKSAKKSAGKKGAAKKKAAKKSKGKGAAAAPNAQAAKPFTAPQLAKLYDFPTGLDGSGQCIGIIELGGGYTTSDLQHYFSNLGIAMPSITAVGVDGSGNHPGDPADVEVTLDIEVAGAVAPGAKYVVYFAPNTSRGFIDAIKQAVHDTQHNPSIISISWGGAEDGRGTTQSYLNSMNQALQDAASMGVTVCVAAGDSGSSDGINDHKTHADFPGSSPFSLTCGGTKLIASGSSISSEVVWNEGRRGGAGGGAVSVKFPKPTYQANTSIPPNPQGKPGRGGPDVTGDADPNSGYIIFVQKQQNVVGGTSAVAPLWAGLLALINQRLKSKGSNQVGFLNPLIYGQLSTSGAFHDIVTGNNDMNGNLDGQNTAKAGWDAASGMGSPDGAKLLKALGG